MRAVAGIDDQIRESCPSSSLPRRPSVTKSIGSFYGNLMAVAVGNALSMKFSGLFSGLGERYRF